MTADFNWFLNKQGPRGQQGIRGEQGFSPIITVAEDTAKAYILRIQTQDDTFLTPNLRGTVDDLGGTYVRYNPETGQVYAGSPDIATTETFGVIRLASAQDVTDRAQDAAITPDLLANQIEELNLPNNYVTTNTNQTINAAKNFAKRVEFTNTSYVTFRNEVKAPSIIEPYHGSTVISYNQDSAGNNRYIQVGGSQGKVVVKPSLKVVSNNVEYDVISTKDLATTEKAGIVKPDSSTVFVDENGVISAKSTGIDDDNTSTQSTWSSSKINSEITTVAQEVVGVQGDVASLDTDMSVLKPKVEANHANIVAINDSLTVAMSDINELKEGKQDKLTAGSAISIDNNTVSVSLSSFDMSNFEIVGSPTISDTGVASGFSTNNYVKYNIPATELPFKIIVKINTGSADTDRTFISMGSGMVPEAPTYLHIGQDNILRANFSDTSAIEHVLSAGNVPAETDLFVKMEWDGNYYVVSYSNNGQQWVDGDKIENRSPSLAMAYQGGMCLGYDINYNLALASGSIDLSTLSISINGASILSSNKTLYEALGEKQDKLTAGTNITIEGNVISATGGAGGSGTQITSADGSVEYGELALGDTLAVADGVLNANLDEIGNEVNTLAGRVTTVEGEVANKQDKFRTVSPIALDTISYNIEAASLIDNTKFKYYVDAWGTNVPEHPVSINDTTELILPTKEAGSGKLDRSKVLYYVGDLKNAVAYMPMYITNYPLNQTARSMIVGKLYPDDTFIPKYAIGPMQANYINASYSLGEYTSGSMTGTKWTFSNATSFGASGSGFWNKLTQIDILQNKNGYPYTKAIYRSAESGSITRTDTYGTITTDMSFDQFAEEVNCVIFDVRYNVNYNISDLYITKDGANIWDVGFRSEDKYLQLNIGDGLSVVDGKLTAAGGSTPENMVTTDTDQEITAKKIFSKGIKLGSLDISQISFDGTGINIGPKNNVASYLQVNASQIQDRAGNIYIHNGNIGNYVSSALGLFDSKYSDHELNNLSWLKSNGQWNAKAVYTDAYDKLLKVYNGTETVEGLSVKLSTETYTDYDFVINTADETFRLPLLDGSEDLVSDKYINLENSNSGSWNTAPANGYVLLEKVAYNGQNLVLWNETKGFGICLSTSGNFGHTALLPVLRGDDFSVHYSATGETIKFRFIYAKGNGSLYYYVGETVQNANLIDAGRIGEILPTKTDKAQAAQASMPSSKYIDLTLGASNATYTAPANGWVLFDKNTSSGQNIVLWNITKTYGFSVSSSATFGQAILLPVSKGDVFKTEYTATGTTNFFRFIYAEGEQ